MKGGGVWVGGCGVGGDEAESEEEVDALQSDHDRMIRIVIFLTKNIRVFYLGLCLVAC